ncbi:MerC domain-containing protein [Roseibacillus persicicus]|uniref:MerC domain-containing protein n=1 Tax=Roseibacillus persicicus TaxID=454148 RepID=UPI00398B2A00
MNTPTNTFSSSLTLQKVDRVGVATSVLCAIHCGLAPILLLALPSFGRIWAHPASHILVALFVVPLAIFSIRKGYRTHRKLWVLVTASIGIFFVLFGAALPAFGKADQANNSVSLNSEAAPQSEAAPAAEEVSGDSTCSEGCCSLPEGETEAAMSTGCVDNCCPSLQMDASGKASLHIPPAAIVTTMGGLFLIAAHIGSLCLCGHACRTSKCVSCA